MQKDPPQRQVSTEIGLGLICHYQPPHDLNSQHPPRTGRPKQTQGTSSICSLADF